MVTAGNHVCDVGCDHGYIPIYLVRSGISPGVIAVDCNEGPLRRAREHIKAFGLEEYIVTRLSDGVAALEKEEAETLVIAGMGGRLIVRILTEGREKVRMMKELILQPQSDIAGVRQFLRNEGYAIAEEDMVYEDGKYYPVIKAVQASEEDTDGSDRSARTDRMPEIPQGLSDAYGPPIWQAACDRYGPCLLCHRHPVLYRYLLWEQEREKTVAQRLTAAGEATSRRREREAELAQSAQVRACALTCFASADQTNGRLR